MNYFLQSTRLFLAGGLALLVFVGGRAEARKPSPIAWITCNLAGEVPADRDLDLIIQVSPRRGFTVLNTRIRTLGAISLKGRLTQTRLAGEGLGLRQHAISARLGSRTTGYVVVDVEGVSSGRKQTISRSFPLRAPGMPPAEQSIGRFGRDTAGQPIIVLSAQPK